MKDESEKCYLGIIKGDTVNTLLTLTKSLPIISYHAYRVVDYNRDNAMDVIISGEKNGVPLTVVYLNKRDFGFEEKTLTLPLFSIARFADMDNDARPEIIISGENPELSYLKILKQQSEYSWNVVHDSVMIHCTAIETVDADGDGDLDLFVSGKLKPDSLHSGFLINNGNFYFQSQNSTPLLGNTSIGDLDNDGFFEIILMAEDAQGQSFIKKYQRTSGIYSIQDVPIALKNGSSFITDFNFDGIVDVNYSGTAPAGSPINGIWYSNNELDTLAYPFLSQRFGDIEHDGDLDLIQLERNGSLELYLYRNHDVRKNLGPGKPKDPVAISVFNRLFMYWKKPADDHTPQASLTFDLFLNGDANYQAGEFDLVNEKRLTVTHGNNGTENFKLLRDVSASGLNFSIQAIDNAFHAGGLCIGAGGTCATLEVEEIAACSKEDVVLSAAPEVLWFSLAEGFLGKSNEFNFSTEKGDTVFYYNPAVTGCPSLKAWTIKISKPELSVSADHYKIVKGSEVQLHVEGAQRYVWTPDTGLNNNDVANPVASPLNSIDYIVTGYDSLGCTGTTSVSIVVEETSFIPSLFSPNDDGQNDQLKIYGLGSAQHFSFSIYNREGALVYKTSDVSEVVQRGWDGTKNGAEQPSGVYFWKVKGQGSVGQVLLNGKDSGSVVLIR